MDGKHVRIMKPPDSGSDYFSYKKFFSTVLFPVLGAHYEFLYVHTGTNGRTSDSTVMNYTKFYKLLCNGGLNLPSASILPNSSQHAPYVFLADSAFPLTTTLMKPYPWDHPTYEQLHKLQT